MSAGQREQMLIDLRDERDDGFRKLWRNGIGSDVTLVVEGRRFHVHSFPIRAANPEFFGALIECMKRQEERGEGKTDAGCEVELNEKMPVTAAAMEAILDYAYSGQMKLNSMNAVEVLKAIDFFLMMNIMKKCADFVLAHAITTDNAFPLRSLFSDARLCDCKARANNFIKENFENITSNVHFLQLKNTDLLEIIPEVQTRFASKIVYTGIINWLDYKPEERIQDVSLLIPVLYRHIKNNFEEFSSTSHFLELNVNDLVAILRSGEIHSSASEEENPYDALIRWLKHRGEERKEFQWVLNEYIMNNPEGFAATSHFLELSVDQLMEIIDIGRMTLSTVVRWLEHKPGERKKHFTRVISTDKLIWTHFATFSCTPYFLALDINELSTIISSKDLSIICPQKEHIVKAVSNWLTHDFNSRKKYGPFLSNSLRCFHSIENESVLGWMQNIDAEKLDGVTVTVTSDGVVADSVGMIGGQMSKLRIDPQSIFGIIEQQNYDLNPQLINVRDKNGRTGLHYLFCNFKMSEEIVIENIRKLVKYGADIDAQDDNGDTPLIKAASRNMYNVVKALVNEFKADYTLTENNGETALHCAISVLGFEIAMFLLGLPNIDVNAVANRAITPLMMLCGLFIINESLQIAQRLVELGADVDHQGDECYEGYRGQTALHKAAEMENLEMIKFLIDKNANMEIIDNRGRTPFFIAVNNGKQDAVKLLLEKGVDFEKEDENGTSPLQQAKKLRFDGIVKIIEEYQHIRAGA